MKPFQIPWLAAAVLVALAARAPGVLWGYNFPGGWVSHHPDEATHVQLAKPLINPYEHVEWQHPYPKGMALHAALPLLVMNLAKSGLKLADATQIPKAPDPIRIIVAGRIASGLYGTASVIVVFLIARMLFGNARVALVAAWMLALGGLHVTQSHFFLSDVAALFWLLLGTWFLLREIRGSEAGSGNDLAWGALCFGVAFGIKLAVTSLPALGLLCLCRAPRVRRVLYAAVFFFAGYAAINFLDFTPFDLVKALIKGTNDPFLWSVWDNLWLYLLELPSIVSLAVVLLFVGGIIPLAKRWLAAEPLRRNAVAVVVLLPLAVYLFAVAVKLDHFARHLVMILPWIFLVAAWSLVTLSEWLRARRVPAFVPVALVFAYLVAFVYDGERVFLREPRNEAARWLQQNVPQGTSIYWRGHTNFPGYVPVNFHDGQGRPPVLMMEMYRINPILSGMSWRATYPRDHRYIFEARTQKYVDNLQALFKGESEYRQVASFDEGYFMPEYNWVNHLIGNRSRNYVSEIVIFTRPFSPEEQAVAAMEANQPRPVQP